MPQTGNVIPKMTLCPVKADGEPLISMSFSNVAISKLDTLSSLNSIIELYIKPAGDGRVSSRYSISSRFTNDGFSRFILASTDCSSLTLPLHGVDNIAQFIIHQAAIVNRDNAEKDAPEIATLSKHDMAQFILFHAQIRGYEHLSDIFDYYTTLSVEFVGDDTWLDSSPSFAGTVKTERLTKFFMQRVKNDVISDDDVLEMAKKYSPYPNVRLENGVFFTA